MNCFQWFERPENSPVESFQRERGGAPRRTGWQVKEFAGRGSLKVARQAAVHIVRYLRRKNTKITGFNPLIATKDAESAISLFEALGFEKRHTKEGVGEDNATDVRMQDANGFHVDVARVESLEKDMAGILFKSDCMEVQIRPLLPDGRPFRLYDPAHPAHPKSRLTGNDRRLASRR